ncbi:MAG: hypothetical protein KER_03040 [Kerstersia gyiorum]|uniref:hypothetical protein n=1 Tax=Kerstersia gyiorum TaxID=206506 RepID=UPI0030CC3A61
MLEVDTSTPFPETRMVASKYDEKFSLLKPGQSIKCETVNVGRTANALRKWLQNRNRQDVVVRTVSKMPDGYGRVFMMPAKPIRMADVPGRKIRLMSGED